MQEAAIVSVARTPIAKAYRGAFNDTEAPVLGGHVLRACVERAGVDAEKVDDVIMGAAAQQGTQGYNLGRLCVYTAGFPQRVSGMTLDRQCSSGLMSIAIAAKNIMTGEQDIVLGGGLESISLTQNAHKNSHRLVSEAVIAQEPGAYIPMIETAELVASRYGISREAQDAYALQSQQRASRAISEGRFKDQILPIEVKVKREMVPFDTDEHVRHDATLEALSDLRAVFDKEGSVTAGNASGINDGAAALVLMEAEAADKAGRKPVAKLVGYAHAGVEPSEMGVGPIPAVKNLMERTGLKREDFDVIESNEAFAAQVLACLRAWADDWFCEKILGLDKAFGEIDQSILNIDGGAISLGHPVGTSGNRITLHLVHSMRRLGARYGVATECIGGGMGGAMLLEIM